MNYSEDFISGVYAHAVKAVKLTRLVSGTLPIDHDATFVVGLLCDADKNCSLFVMAGETELLRSESFEWKNSNDTTERLFRVCDHLTPSSWAQMDAANDCSWNLQKLDTEVILGTLAQGYHEIGEKFDPANWHLIRIAQKKSPTA